MPLQYTLFAFEDESLRRGRLLVVLLIIVVHRVAVDPGEHLTRTCGRRVGVLNIQRGTSSFTNRSSMYQKELMKGCWW